MSGNSPAASKCTVCRSPRRAEVDAALERGAKLRPTARRFGCSYSSLVRHRAHEEERDKTTTPRPLPASTPTKAPLSKPHRGGVPKNRLPGDGEDARANAVAVLRVLREHLEAADRDQVPSIANAITSSSRLLSRLSGQLEITEAQIVRSVPWRKMRAVFEGALAPFPEAARAVGAALDEAFGERG